MKKPASERYRARQERKGAREREAARLHEARTKKLAEARDRWSALRLRILPRGDCLSAELVERHVPVLHYSEPMVQCGACPVANWNADTWPCQVVKTLEAHAGCREDFCERDEAADNGPRTRTWLSS